VIGHLTALLTMMKGLPLAYNKDMQEDKEPLFDTVDTLQVVLPAFTRLVRSASFRRERMAGGTAGDCSTATDLADLLVRGGMPFRQAHETVGRVVRHCIEQQVSLEALEPSDLVDMVPQIVDAGDGAAEV